MPDHIVILGAGISGLATGWFLKQTLGTNFELTILEKESQVGGWMKTIQEEGFLFEQGPRSCRTKGAGQETLALVESLDLQDQVIIPHQNAQKRYIYNTAGLSCLPNHLWQISFNPLTSGWIQAFWRDWTMPKCQIEDESIASFFSRRLGKKWVDCLIDPFVSGIYAGDCQRLSLKSCFPLFHQWEQEKGSLIRGAWSHRSISSYQSKFIQSMRHVPLFSFQKGMQTLPLRLAQKLKNHLMLNQSIRKIKQNAQRIEIELENKEQLQADYVISTLPTFSLKELLENHISFKHQLDVLRYATVYVVNLGFQSNVLPHQGFGYLIPSNMQSQLLGCVWDSCLFPQQNQGEQTRLTMMIGGVHHPEVEHLTEQEAIAQALQALQKQLNIQAIPQVIQTKKAYRAIPQYEIGYANWRQNVQAEFKQLFPRLILTGSAWNGVSINDCILQARHLAQLFNQ